MQKALSHAFTLSIRNQLKRKSHGAEKTKKMPEKKQPKKQQRQQQQRSVATTLKAADTAAVARSAV